MDLTDVVKDVEKEKGMPAEIIVRYLQNGNIDSASFGDLDKRRCRLTSMDYKKEIMEKEAKLQKEIEGEKEGYKRDILKLKLFNLLNEYRDINNDLNKLEGEYENIGDLRRKMMELSKLDGGVIGGGSMEGVIREQVGDACTKRTLFGSELLYNLLRLKRFGVIFYDTNKEREMLKEEFRKNSIAFLNNHYVLTPASLYCGSSDCHGVISGRKVARLEYDLLK